jgi:hypothetical protein
MNPVHVGVERNIKNVVVEIKIANLKFFSQQHNQTNPAPTTSKRFG